MIKSKRQVFIVDDDEDDRTILRDAFLENGYADQFVLFQSGVELMDHLQTMADIPALIIIDLHMPGKDGRELIKELKTNPTYKAIPVVIFSTGVIIEIRNQLLQMGANSVVSKPNSYDEIVSMTGCIGTLWNLGM